MMGFLTGIKNWKAILIGVVGLTALISVWLLNGARARAIKQRDAAREELVMAKAELSVLRVDAAAREQAATNRVKDTAEVAAQQKELVDAIKDIPDTTPDSIRVALGCERLRAFYGEKHSALPAACRSGR